MKMLSVPFRDLIFRRSPREKEARSTINIFLVVSALLNAVALNLPQQFPGVSSVCVANVQC